MQQILKKVSSLLYYVLGGIYYIWARIQVPEMGKGCTFHNFCRLSTMTHIGNDCHFNGMKVWGGVDIYIGDHFHSGEGCRLITSTHNYESSKLPYDDVILAEPIIIEQNVWIGINVILLPGTILREGSIIQAERVVVGEIPRGGIAGGHPAKVFKYRNNEHYSTLVQL